LDDIVFDFLILAVIGHVTSLRSEFKIQPLHPYTPSHKKT